jgi:restriction system protein
MPGYGNDSERSRDSKDSLCKASSGLNINLYDQIDAAHRKALAVSAGQQSLEAATWDLPPESGVSLTGQPPELMQLQRELALQSWDAVHRELPWIRDLVRARNRVVRAVVADPLVADDDDQTRRQYAVARHAEVVARHSAQAARVHDLMNLLGSALVQTERFDLTALRQAPQRSTFEPGVAGISLVPPVWADFAPDETPGRKRLIDDQKHRELRLADARDRFQRALRVHGDAEIARQGALVGAQRTHLDRGAARDAATKAHNDGLDVFAGVLDGGDPEAVAGYFGLVLCGSVYPIDFPQHFRLVYLPELSELVVEVTLPGVEVIPTASELQYVSESDDVAVSPRGAAQVESMYASVVAQVILRTLHELFDADSRGWLETVTFNGMTTQTGTARNDRGLCLVTVRTTPSQFAGLNLTRDDPQKTLGELGAAVFYSCQRQEPIRDLSAVDPRHIVETDVLTDLDNRLDVRDLTAGQFEHLIHELLPKMGLHIKHIRSSEDGVVDCLVFDARPVLGGDVVVHAARHVERLDVWTVQRLHRAVTDAGATKGILITTAGIDSASHAYASGKPLELIDGQGILGLIAQHTGIRVRVQQKDRRAVSRD